MGFFDFITKNKKQKQYMGFADVLNGNTPIYNQFGDNIYKSDVVQQAISCIVTEMKKLTPKHIREKDGKVEEVTNRELNALLEIPNDLMICSDFIERIIWKYETDYNVFIYPTYITYKDKNGKKIKKYTGLYPLNPIQVDWLEDDKSGIIYVKLVFENGSDITLPYSELIHLRKNFSVNDYMGGNKNGQPDNAALLQTLEINNALLDSVEKSVNTPINGVITYTTLLSKEKAKEAKENFEKQLREGKSAILALDVGATYTSINGEIKSVDAATLKFIDEKILRNYGVSLPILTGEYSKEQYEAFYQKTLEPLIIQLGQAFTKTLFTAQERSYGNKIVFYPEELVFMTNDQKLELVKEAGGRGAFTNNQILKIFGLPPYEGGDVRYMSLNYIDVSIANQYQLNNNKGGAKDEQQ